MPDTTPPAGEAPPKRRTLYIGTELDGAILAGTPELPSSEPFLYPRINGAASERSRAALTCEPRGEEPVAPEIGEVIIGASKGRRAP